MNWTEEQREAIDLRDLDLLVSAGAGSGKTAVLVERIKEIIRKGEAELDELLVVTFTNAAAGEMKAKIAAALPDQASRMYLAQISTFDSFALSILRRHFGALSMEPDFGICDEAMGVILKNEAMDQLMEELFEAEDPDLLYFLSRYGSSKNEDGARKMLLQCHTFIQSLPDPFGWLKARCGALRAEENGLPAPAWLELLFTEVSRLLNISLSYCNEAKRLLSDRGLERMTKKVDEDRQQVLALADRLKELQKSLTEGPLEETETLWDAFRSAVSGVSFVRLQANKEETPEYNMVKDLIKEYRQRYKDHIVKHIAGSYACMSLREWGGEMDALQPAAASLLKLCREFDLRYMAKKRERNRLDFSDISHYALEILKDPEIAESYRRQFKYIFIDEYQDSSLVQESLIRAIARPRSLFMVGDVKQSIYKFRLADPELFLEKYHDYGQTVPGSRRVDLNRNFRCKKKIIDAVNGCFVRLMNEDLSGMDYDDAAALKAGCTYEGPLQEDVHLYLVEKQVGEDVPDPELRELKAVELEAAAAAELLASQKGRMFFDAKLGKERPIENRDMVILLRAASNRAVHYCNALERQGLSAFADLGESLLSTVEVSAFLDLLRLLDNGRQDIPLLSSLYSPIFGFSADELAIIRLICRRGPFWGAFEAYAREGADGRLREKCAEAEEKLTSWRRLHRFLPLEEFLWQLLEESGYYAYCGSLPGGESRQANLRLLVDRAAAFRENRAEGLYGFICYVEALQKNKVTLPQARILGEGDDVVRVMTIHKSKGLEFPVVLVAGLGDPFNGGEQSSLTMHKTLGIGLKLVDRERRTYRKTAGQHLIEARQKRENMAEQLRLLYVAMTRPQDRLFLMGGVKTGEEEGYTGKNTVPGDEVSASSYLSLLMPVAKEAGICVHYVRPENLHLKDASREQQRSRLMEKLERGFPEEREQLGDEILANLNWSYEAGPTGRSKYSVSEIAREAAEEEGRQKTAKTGLEEPRFLKKESISGAHRGTIYHTIMEHLPFTAGAERIDVIRSVMEDLVDRQIISREEAESVRPERIRSFFLSPLGKRALAGQDLRKETAFNLMIEKDGREVMVQGIIDCYFREGDSMVLLDYKSNYVEEGKEEELAAYYRPQLALYKKALEEISGMKVKESWLYLFGLEKAIRL